MASVFSDDDLLLHVRPHVQIHPFPHFPLLAPWGIGQKDFTLPIVPAARWVGGGLNVSTTETNATTNSPTLRVRRGRGGRGRPPQPRRPTRRRARRAAPAGAADRSRGPGRHRPGARRRIARPDPLHGEGAGRDRAAPGHGPEHQQRAGGAARRGSGTRGDAGPQLLRAGEARGRRHGPDVRPGVPAAAALGDCQAAGRRRRPAGVALAGTAPCRRPRPCPGDGRQPGRGRRDPRVPVPHGGRPGGGVRG